MNTVHKHSEVSASSQSACTVHTMNSQRKELVERLDLADLLRAGANEAFINAKLAKDEELIAETDANLAFAITLYKERKEAVASIDKRIKEYTYRIKSLSNNGHLIRH